MKLSEALRALIDNPDDLSTLPQLVAQVEQLEQSEESYQERIDKLQAINRSYLAQIPIPGEEPKPADDEEPTVSFEDAQKELLNAFQSVGGRTNG